MIQPVKQYRGALAVLSLPGLIAAKHGHGGGVSIGWIASIIIVIVLLVLGYLAFGRPSEPDEETLRSEAQADLLERLALLNDSACRSVCVLLARDTRSRQRTLYAALAALQGIDPDQDDDGET